MIDNTRWPLYAIHFHIVGRHLCFEGATLTPGSCRHTLPRRRSPATRSPSGNQLQFASSSSRCGRPSPQVEGRCRACADGVRATPQRHSGTGVDSTTLPNAPDWRLSISTASSTHVSAPWSPLDARFVRLDTPRHGVSSTCPTLPPPLPSPHDAQPA